MTDGFMTHEEMLEEATKREEEVTVTKEPAYKTLNEMTREERVEAGLQEVWYLVRGGMDGREYANSIKFIVQVLESLK
jgi:hypothetical protein